MYLERLQYSNNQVRRFKLLNRISSLTLINYKNLLLSYLI